jgi:putative MFS transporter
MNAALGTGVAALLWSILEPAGASWRWLYVASLPPLLFVGYLRRRLPESRRFLEAQEKGTLAQRWHAILRPGVRRWLALIVVTTALIQLGQWAVNFTIDFLETERHVSTATANLMLIAAGLPGIPIMIAAGALSDRFGRRLVGCAFGLAAVAGAIGLFWLPGGVPVLLPCMSLAIIGQLGSYPVLQTFTSELFPTRIRSSASAWANVASVVGRAVSLGLGALLLLELSPSATATILGVGPLLAIVIIAVMFPDTHGRELEDITGEEAVTLSAIH